MGILHVLKNLSHWNKETEADVGFIGPEKKDLWSS